MPEYLVILAGKGSPRQVVTAPDCSEARRIGEQTGIVRSVERLAGGDEAYRAVRRAYGYGKRKQT